MHYACLIILRPGLSAAAVSSEVTVLSVQLMPNNPDQILVGIKGSQVLFFKCHQSDVYIDAYDRLSLCLYKASCYERYHLVN